jgi:hypothetical protein
MTATLDRTFVDDEGETITPGTLCWGRTGASAPLNWRHKDRVMAVYSGGINEHQWMLLLPNTDTTSDQGGWRIAHYLSVQQINDLNLERFLDSHRGWWPTPTGFTFTETCVGYWCSLHQVFHGAETCPPDRLVADARIAQLERDLADARAANEALVKDHEEFKVKASDVLAEGASEHDLCGVYDEWAERAGLYPRRGDYEVEVEVTYRQTLTVRARHEDEAQEWVSGRSVVPRFAPPTIFHPAENIRAINSAYDLSFTVVD